jgi:diguanylate cyclase (GGDEF)-like protein/PAS domain S-box-containing protein
MVRNGQKTIHGLVTGFSVALALILVILAVGLSSMEAIQERLKKIVNNYNTKTELVVQMRYAARERMVSLYRMVLTSDPFARDEMFMAFNRFAGPFVQARMKLLDMELSENEKQVLLKQGALSAVAIDYQKKVIELIFNEQIAKATELLYQETIAAQDDVFEQLNQLIEIQRKATQRGEVEASNEYDNARQMMFVFGFAAILIGGIVAVVVVKRAKSSEAVLYREKERALVTLHSIGDGVITTDAAGNVEYLNPIASKLTGWTNLEAKGKPLLEVFRIAAEDGAVVENPIMKAIRDQRIIESTEPMLLRLSSDESYMIENSVAPIVDFDGSTMGAIVVFRNVTAMREMAHQMAYQATHDALTGLINRKEFETRLLEAINHSRVNNEKHVLCYMDLDQIKVVNDTCGHIAGDELLRQIAKILHKRIRRADTLARLGGDEFGILFLDCSINKAHKIVDDLRVEINEYRFIWEDKAFNVSTSIGLAEITHDSGGMTEVMSAADSACFVAKDLGRNRIHVFAMDDEDLARRRGEMQWLPKIKSALEDDNFCLYFQQIVKVEPSEDATVFIELLIRMLEDGNPVVPPMAFIPAAERYDLMPQLDRWVVRKAFARLKQVEQQQNHQNSFIWAINLSGHTLCDTSFLDFVFEEHKLSGINPNHICFEITETAAVANLSSASHLITSLQAKGFRFALDDFGSGLSSFGYLKNLPVDYLKIDGNFVKDMLHDEVDFAMVEAINQIGHTLGLLTIAEFVEDENLMRLLKSIGVDFVQGNAIHPPQLLEEMPKTVIKQAV